MFKKIIISAITLSMALSAPLQTSASAISKVKVYLNGHRVNFISDPQLRNGNTFVPMRVIFEELGASLKWDEDTKSITAKKGTSTIHLTIGDNKAINNGREIMLNEAPIIIAGTTFVPLRFVSESINTEVGWIGESNTVTINSAGKQKFKISRVRDGDTFEGTYEDGPDSGKKAVIRMIGIDTPETVKENTPVQFYGPESSEHTKKILTDKTVYLVRDKTDDPYGRTLAYVFQEDGSLYNAELVSQGYARALAIEPNTRWKDLFADLETDAKLAHRGLWVSSNPDKEQLIKNILEKKASEFGFSNGEFHPEQLITEDLLLKYLIIALFPETKAIFLAKTFYELSQDEQFEQLVRYAVNAGLVMKDEIKEGKAPVTLSHAVSMLNRALNIKDLGNEISLSHFGIYTEQTNPEAKLTMGETLLLLDKTKKVYAPLKAYFSNMADAVRSSETVEKLSQTLSDLNLSEKMKTFAADVKTSIIDSEYFSDVKEGASDLMSLLKGGWKDIANMIKIKDAVNETKDSLKSAEEALKEALSIN